MAQSARSFVGRDAELVSLSSLVGVASAAPRASRRHVLLAGDAGVGKTRLLTELRDCAVADGWQVYAGHCLDLGESALSYLPFSEVLDRLVAELPDVVEQLATAYPAMARLQPVRRMIGWRGGPDADTPDRANLFEAVHSLLEAVSEKGPTLLVVEDLHWADQSTRDLLSFLFTRPFAGPVGLVASYRSDDLHRRHPLRQQAAEWTRLSSVERLSLAPLDDESVRTLVDELDAGLPNAERETIVQRAEGNAFFVEELVGAARGEHIPDNLADVLLVRLDRLDETARPVVRTASVSGRRVGHELLESVVGVPAAELEAALRSAVELNILVPSNERYRFRHALLAEAVYDDLLPGERVRLHARYATALLDNPSLGTAAELAWHAREAHDLPVALTASIRAGGDAMAVGGPDEAAEHFQTALALAADPATCAAVEVEVDVTRLTVRAVDALMMAGRIARAATLAAEQLDRLPGDAPASDRARLLAAHAEALLPLESGTQPLDVSAEAVETLPDDAPASVRAAVLAIRARVLAGYDQFEEAQAAGLDALDVAERHDLHAAASDAIMTLSGLGREGPKDALRASLREAIERAHSAGAIDAEMRGRYHLARSYEDWAEWDEAIRWFGSAVDLAASHGVPWAPYGLEARWQLLWVYVVLGRWDEAERLGTVSAGTRPRVLQAMLDSVRMRIDQARGADVSRETRALRRYWESEGTIPVNAVTLEIEGATRTRDPAAVLQVYDDAVASLGATWHPWFSARIRFAALTAAGVARSLPTTPAAGWTALADRVAELHDDGDTVLTQYSGHWGVEGRAWMKRLEAETLRVRWLAGVEPPTPEALLETWAECERLFIEFGDVLELAVVRTARASVLRALGDLAGSRATADLARESAHALRAQPLLDDLRSLGSTPVRSGPESTALTPRETEILTLVAAGRTNGEIAKQLFISTKTVSVHVSNILGKLHAAGRTEAAAIGRRRGLIG